MLWKGGEIPLNFYLFSFIVLQPRFFAGIPFIGQRLLFAKNSWSVHWYALVEKKFSSYHRWILGGGWDSTVLKFKPIGALEGSKVVVSERHCSSMKQQHSLLHCNPAQGQYRARTGFSLCTFSHREKPGFITGNPFSHYRDPVIITGNSLWGKVHREIPVFITGNGFAVWTSFDY